MKIYSSFLFLSFCTTSYAYIEAPINEKKPLEVTFSKSSHNRISVENGGVEKIYGDDSLFSISIDKTTGQAFVLLLKDFEKTPKVLTIVTSSGAVQDLHIFSSSNPSEYLLLKEENEEEPLKLPPDFHSTTIELLNDILEGKTPFGFGQRELTSKDKLNLPSPLEVTPLKALTGPFETIILYRICNRGKKPITIQASSLKKPTDSWAFLHANRLHFREESLYIVSSPREGE